jgi:hypothetical protein
MTTPESTTTTTTTAAIPAAQTDTAVVPLDTPIQRGEQTISSVTLRKPKAGELRGLSLSALMRVDVDSLQVLLPRISSPTLTKFDVANLDPVDLVALGGEVLAFLLPKGQVQDFLNA